MKIEITTDDIHNGVKDDVSLCAVALGCKRATGATEVSVDGCYITINGDDYKTPNAVGRFIESFDAGETVEPFSFELP